MSSVPNTPNSLFLGIPSTPEFLAAVDEESISICPLLTPSPSAHFHHPLAINSIPGKVRRKKIKFFKLSRIEYCIAN